MPFYVSELKHAEQSAEVLKAISHPMRIRILDLLCQPPNQPMRVTDIAFALNQAPAAISMHLRLLKDVKVVDNTRDGANSGYHPVRKGLPSLVRNVLELARLDKLAEVATAAED